MLDVLVAGPDHLDRTVDLLRDLRRLEDEVHLQTPAEASAQQVVMNLDSVPRQAGRPSGCGLRAGLDLRPHPDVTAVLADVDGAVNRLHRGVRQKRHLIDRLDLPGRTRQRFGDVAVLARDRARLARGRCELLDDVGGAELRVRALGPADVERGEALLSRPHVVGDHRHGVLEADHLAYALDRLRPAVVEARELAAEHRTRGHRRDLQPREAHVDAELSRAVDLGAAVETLGGRADQLEILGILEHDPARHRQRRRLVHKGAVGERAAGRRVDHGTLHGATGTRVHIPSLSRSRHQHTASSGAGAAQWFPGAAH